MYLLESTSGIAVWIDKDFVWWLLGAIFIFYNVYENTALFVKHSIALVDTNNYLMFKPWTVL